MCAPVPSVIHDPLEPDTVVLMSSVIRSPGFAAMGWHWIAVGPAADPLSGALSHAVPVSGEQPSSDRREVRATVGLLGSGQLLYSVSVYAPRWLRSHQPAPHWGS